MNNEVKGLTEDELRYLQIITNPVSWCQLFLKNPETRQPLVPYDYQAEILLDNSTIRKVLRIGRRGGKTEVLCIHMLWQCIIRPNIVCLVVAPYDRQILEIYDNLIKLLEASEYFNKKTGAYTSTKHPFQIKFSNGSIINLMTAGTKAGSKGAGTRGQKADWIYFDEADYLSDDDINTVMSVILEDPFNIGVMMASTPTGRRGLFYKYCTDPETGFKEYHKTFFDTPVYKNATPEQKVLLERQLRSIYSDKISFEHEVLAEFGTEAVGVFNKKHLDRARSYSVKDGLKMIGSPYKELLWSYYQEITPTGEILPKPIRPPARALRTIGVDWDKAGAPTEIVVVEWIPNEMSQSGNRGMFRVIGRFEIPRSEFTLTNAVNMIVELNDVFKPAFIYVDKGNGETQVEMLHKYGLEHPETELHIKVKPIAFQGKIDIRDPYTGVIDSKQAKHFMISNTSHILDSDMLQLFDEDIELWRQMENYRVVGVSSFGIPIYSKGNEHALDALNLALLAMTLEFPNLAKLISEFKPNYTVISVPRKDDISTKILGPSFGGDRLDDMDPVDRRDYLIAHRTIRTTGVDWAKRGYNKKITSRKSF